MKSIVYLGVAFLFMFLAHAGPVAGFFVANGFALAFFGLALGERLSAK